MAAERLKVPKCLMPVVLWVHPEGRVIGSLYLREQSSQHAGAEEPLEVLNQANPFVVVRRERPEELRFYNRASIVRVEYAEDEDATASLPGLRPLSCELHMMDGSVISGTIRELLPPDRARLFDYLNQTDNHYIKIYLGGGDVCLVNKSYIVCTRTLDV